MKLEDPPIWIVQQVNAADQPTVMHVCCSHKEVDAKQQYLRNIGKKFKTWSMYGD